MADADAQPPESAFAGRHAVPRSRFRPLPAVCDEALPVFMPSASRLPRPFEEKGRRQQADPVAQTLQVLGNNLTGVVVDFDQVNVHR